jgi:hypothetical protein
LEDLVGDMTVQVESSDQVRADADAAASLEIQIAAAAVGREAGIGRIVEAGVSDQVRTEEAGPWPDWFQRAKLGIGLCHDFGSSLGSAEGCGSARRCVGARALCCGGMNTARNKGKTK